MPRGSDLTGADAEPTTPGSRRRLLSWRTPGRPDRRTVGRDLGAGVLLGVEGVPDGLASGLLAGVNPLAGVYAYLYGMVGAATLTSSAFMAVQATGAMALVVADVDLASRPDPERALFTLAVLTGVVMVAAGLLRAGTLLRFVPTAVMTGFVTAVGVNIVLGQLGNFTGYAAAGSNRLLRAADLLVHPGRIEPAALLVGVTTLVGILALRRTALRSMGLVVAVALGSALAAVLGNAVDPPVALVRDLATLPGRLPAPVLPDIRETLYLLVPALSLALVGLVQGAAVSAGIPNPGGRRSDRSRDFVGQGAGNVLAGLFQGMPVGGSMSGSALVVAGGARSRAALLYAGGVMAVVLLVLNDLVGHVAMPALAALLIIVGASAIKPAQVLSVVKTGPLQITVMAVTFTLTLLIPLHYAVLFGVGLAIVLYVAEQSNRVTVRRLVLETDGRTREEDPPAEVPPESVLVLQPYGSLFFASAPIFEAQLPDVTAASAGSVVVLRLRGVDQLGLSLIEVVRRYARELHASGSSLKLVISGERVLRQLTSEGIVALLGADNVYVGTEWLGETVRRAHAEAVREIQQDRGGRGPGG